MEPKLMSDQPQQEAAALRAQVVQLQAEREQLRQCVQNLQAECARLTKERSLLLHALADRLFSEEELDRASKETGGCSLAEIWERLEKTCVSR